MNNIFILNAKIDTPLAESGNDAARFNADVYKYLLASRYFQLRKSHIIVRLTDSSYAVARHAANAWQRSTSLLLRLLHLRHHRRSVVVWAAAKPLLS